MRSYSKASLICSYVLIICFVFFYPKFTKDGAEATISYDVAGYYMYLPAIFIYSDIHHLNFQDDLNTKYQFNPGGNQGVILPNGEVTMKYPIGAAIFYSPFFFIAHGWASATGMEADGFSAPYQMMLSIGCLLYAFLGLFILRKILLCYFSDLVAGITIFLMVAATNYLNYSAIDNAMTHNLLFTLYAVLIWLTIKFYKNPKAITALCIGLICGLATITRPTDIICILIPLFWNVNNAAALKARILLFFSHFRLLLSFLFGAIIMGSFQIVYWKLTTGQFLFYSYEEQSFSWLNTHLNEALFSYKKGWFLYTPFLIFIIPGFIFLYKKHQAVFFPVFLFTIINIYIAFSWDIWWYGGSLGQRSMVQSYVLLSFPIAALVETISKASKLVNILFYACAVFCIWFNLTLTIQAHNKYGILDDDAMNRVYFWKIFGKIKIDPDTKKYLDTFESFHGNKLNIREIYFNDIENNLTEIDSTSILFGKKCLFVNADHQFTPLYAVPLPTGDATWINISADFYFPFKEWEVWKMPQLLIQFKDHGEIIKVKSIRIHRIMDQGEKKNLNYDVEIPETKFDAIEFYLWNAGGITTTYMDNIKVVAFE